MHASLALGYHLWGIVLGVIDILSREQTVTSCRAAISFRVASRVTLEAGAACSGDVCVA